MKPLVEVVRVKSSSQYANQHGGKEGVIVKADGDWGLIRVQFSDGRQVLFDRDNLERK